MKVYEKEESRKLRRKGLSLKEIAELLHVAKSSVSLWVRDIELSSIAKDQIQDRAYKLTREKVSLQIKEKYRKMRQDYRLEGYNLENSNFDKLCMLYWAEGSKCRNVLQLTNSDPDMILYFLKLVNDVFDLKEDNVSCSFAIQCYTDVFSQEEIEKYWSQLVNEPLSKFTKTQVNKTSKSSTGKRHGVLKYGTFRISIFSTKYVQMVYGRISKLSGKDIDYWE